VRVILLLVLSLAAALSQTSPSRDREGAVSSSPQERGKRAIDETLAALGGERFLAVQDRAETGRAYSFYRERLSGLSLATIYTRYVQRPEPPVPGTVWVRERQSFGKNERSGAVLFADGKGYQITFRGARPVSQETEDRYQDSTLHNVFYILRQRLGEPGLAFDYRGTDRIDNRPVEIVDISDADNRTVTVYLDHFTKLPIRQLYVRRDPKTRDRIEEVTLFSKYRDVGGGVQWPLDIQRLRNDEKIFEMYSETVEINKGVSQSLFVLPPGIGILKPLK
jgi:hypothetical protein